MGGGKSEYGKQFSPKRSILSCNQAKVFQENVGYREYRRKLENWHSHDPFTWNVRKLPRGGVTENAGKGSVRSSSSSSTVGEEATPDGRDTSLWQQKDRCNQTPVTWADDVTLPNTPKSDKKPRRKTAPPRVRKRPDKLVPAALPEQIPFLPYGTGFRGIETGDKRTYNIKAGALAHNAALRAQKRRQAEIQLRSQQQQKKSSKSKISQEEALFNERVARQTDCWETEYSSHYPPHDKSEYERNISARKIGGVTFNAAL